ncbi:MAG: HAD family hydrolase [Planctomycetes bacterium]|jgi:D-glycero-D-manno-heptose 1,7-bisphosphate phosphatase|nr:HAD family hydrolase [Planctomycetota bacterium]
MPGLRPAVFLDRDGTLNVDRSYILRPEDMQLLPGVGEALRRLQAAGFACVVVTNQSAVGRGMMTDVDLDQVHAEMKRQLAALGVTLDGIYACTIAPRTEDKIALEYPDRKPGPGMLLRAAADLGLDLARSWMIGDTLRDILAGQNAGCHECILVRTGHPIDETQFGLAEPFHVADDLVAAARLVLANYA